METAENTVKTVFFSIFFTLKDELAALRIADIMRMAGARSHCENKNQIEIRFHQQTFK